MRITKPSLDVGAERTIQVNLSSCDLATVAHLARGQPFDLGTVVQLAGFATSCVLGLMAVMVADFASPVQLGALAGIWLTVAGAAASDLVTNPYDIFLTDWMILLTKSQLRVMDKSHC